MSSSATQMSTELDLERIIEEVTRFQLEIIGMPPATKPETLGTERMQWSVTAMQEEVNEFVVATEADNVIEAADALIDLIYFAAGRLYEMGVPASEIWVDVQRANMAKRRGELSKRPNSMGYDAVKPEGWQGPNHNWLVEITPWDVKNLQERAARRERLKSIPADVTSTVHAMKFSTGKVPLSLIPMEGMVAEAQAFDYGRNKYAAWNHLKGRPVSEYIDAALRHIYSFASGENLDPEADGTVHHLGAARANLSMTLCVLGLHPEMDDRRINP